MRRPAQWRHSGLNWACVRFKNEWRAVYKPVLYVNGLKTVVSMHEINQDMTEGRDGISFILTILEPLARNAGTSSSSQPLKWFC
jgi:hypothetical protein